MEKDFNVTGTCFPHLHYMADISAKFNETIKLVNKGQYFAINRPRQYGKTTMLRTITRALMQSDEWLVFNISFEGIDSATGAEVGSFCQAFLEFLAKRMRDQEESELVAFLEKQSKEVKTLKELSNCITELVKKANRKTVLLIDEVDKSSNNQLFLDFLGILRDKYLNRDAPSDLTFHSVILAGLYDVKSLKAKIRPDSEAKYNSPWNIAADFEVVMELQPNEIVPMLADYAQERDVKMDFPAIAEALFYYTSGYPFLVSALCKLMDEKILPTKSERTWTVLDIETAADKLIRSEISNTNFDTLIKNLENDAALYNLVYRLVIENELFNFNHHDPLINKGILHGILRGGDGLNIQNRIYREIIVNYMTSKTLTTGQSLYIDTAEPYLLANNALDMRRVLLKFQELMHLEYSKKDGDFIERHGRLIFLAFLKPILNGKGYAFKEPEISEERRMDIAVSFCQHKYVVELKMWRGKVAHAKGLKQLGDYMDRQQLPEGFLVIFEQTTAKTWKKGWLKVNGKRVFAVWV